MEGARPSGTYQRALMRFVQILGANGEGR